jgi:hypothetical protein
MVRNTTGAIGEWTGCAHTVDRYGKIPVRVNSLQACSTEFQHLLGGMNT